MSIVHLVCPILVMATFGFCLGIQVADAQAIKTFGSWRVECKIDKMSDERICQIELPLDPEKGSTGPRIRASLITLDLGLNFCGRDWGAPDRGTNSHRQKQATCNPVRPNL